MEEQPVDLKKYQEKILRFISKAENDIKVLNEKFVPQLLRIVKLISKLIYIDFKLFREPLVRMLQVFVTLRSTSPNKGFEVLLEKITKPFVLLTMYISEKWTTLRYLFKCWLLLTTSLPGCFVKDVALSNVNILTFLEDCLSSAGEYRNQRIVMLLIFAMMKQMSPDEISFFVQEMFTQKEFGSIRQSLMQPVNFSHPEKSIRMFLNKYNSVLENREIISLELTTMFFGELPGIPFEDGELWIDFNKSPLCITIYCSSRMFLGTLEDKIALIYLPVKIIKKLVCKGKNNQLEILIQTSEKITVTDMNSGITNDFLDIRKLQCNCILQDEEKSDFKIMLEAINQVLHENKKEGGVLVHESNAPDEEQLDVNQVQDEPMELEEEASDHASSTNEPDREVPSPEVDRSFPSPIRALSVASIVSNPDAKEDNEKFDEDGKENVPEDSGISLQMKRRTIKRIESSSSNESLQRSQASSVWRPAFPDLQSQKKNHSADIEFVCEFPAAPQDSLCKERESVESQVKQKDVKPIHDAYILSDENSIPVDFETSQKTLKKYGSMKDHNEDSSFKELAPSHMKRKIESTVKPALNLSCGSIQTERKFFKNINTPPPWANQEPPVKKKKTAAKVPKEPRKSRAPMKPRNATKTSAESSIAKTSSVRFERGIITSTEAKPSLKSLPFAKLIQAIRK
ncbi:hypothetical protein DMENIID0001_035230 [Sergentomyia squamirostris]